MKSFDIPMSGRFGPVVYYRREGKQYIRRHVKPKEHRTDAQRHVREAMGALAKAWGGWLSEAERQVWNAAAERLRSRVRLGQSGPLIGAVLFTKLNCPLVLIVRDRLRLPTEPVVFGSSPVGELSIVWEPGSMKLTLAVLGPVTDDIMVFATPPCRPTWRKCRKPRYLGLLPGPVNGISDITELYVRRFGEPPSGQRIFVRTVQQRNGWESAPVDTSDLVPTRELTAEDSIPTIGVLEEQLRTLDFERPTPNGNISGFRGSKLDVRRSMFSVRPVWLHPPCPREMHARHTVSAPWPRAGIRASPARIRGFGRRGRGCRPCPGARDSPWELWHRTQVGRLSN